MGYALQVATLDDVPAIAALIERSARSLGLADYTPAQMEGALAGAFGVDSNLIRDGSYYVVATEAGELVACGGWSRRRTLFGGDTRAERDDAWLDPALDPAKIRAFFVDPGHARRGLGRLLLERSETDARNAGFTHFELMATLGGLRLYQQFGYVAGEPTLYPLPGGIDIRFVPMRKRAGA
jgi:GNAT superfamily N-acetyltransferase